MITTDRQRKLAEKKLALFTARLNDPADGKILPEPVLKKVAADIQDSIDKLQADIDLYDFAMRADLDNLEPSLESLGLIPIIVRLKKHISVREFAAMLGVGHTQITRWESQNYGQCSHDKLTSIISTLTEKQLVRITGLSKAS